MMGGILLHAGGIQETNKLKNNQPQMKPDPRFRSSTKKKPIKIMKQHTAELLLVIAVMIWGSSYIGLKEAEGGFAPFTIITLRFGIAFLFAALIFHRSLTGITRSALAAGAVLGFLLFCLIAFLLYALPTTPTTTAGFLRGNNGCTGPPDPGDFF
jgi:hypothetical protein